MRNLIFGLLGLLILGGAAHMEAQSRVVLDTSLGEIVLELDAEKAPKTVENFSSYVEAGFYDGTIFHRVIPGFMIQGGGMTADMSLKATKGDLENEADNGLVNDRGTVAMARKGEPHSATAQFFINTVDNDFLNHQGKTTQGWGYCVFGSVVDGMEVVDAIAAVPTGAGDVPNETVTIKSVRLASGD